MGKGRKRKKKNTRIEVVLKILSETDWEVLQDVDQIRKVITLMDDLGSSMPRINRHAPRITRMDGDHLHFYAAPGPQDGQWCINMKVYNLDLVCIDDLNVGARHLEEMEDLSAELDGQLVGLAMRELPPWAQEFVDGEVDDAVKGYLEENEDYIRDILQENDIQVWETVCREGGKVS